MKWLLLFFSFFVGAALSAMPQPPQGSQYALLVQDTQGHVLQDYRSDVYLQPASVQKLVTAVAAWLHLGATWRFQTTFWFDAKQLRDQVLHGDLLIEFQGAPDFRRQDLIHMFARAGIKKITGSILLHQSAFTGYAHGPGWSWDNLPVCYAAPASAIVIDHNCVMGALYAKRAGDSPRLNIPAFQPVRVTQSVQVIPTDQQTACDLKVHTNAGNHYHLFGCVKATREPLSLNFAVQDTFTWARDLLKQVMYRQKIDLAGGINQTTQIPNTLQPVVVHHSKTLDELLTTMLRDSDNLIAETLLKTLGRVYFSKPSANFALGVQACVQILKQAGVDLSQASLHDGSGLSVHNLMNAQQIMQILTLLHQHPDFNLKKRLAIGFERGSLRYRRSMQKSPLRGRVYAKSGSLEHVANLAGLIQTPQGERLFVLLVSGLINPGQQADNRAFEYFERDLLEIVAQLPDASDYQNFKVTEPVEVTLKK